MEIKNPYLGNGGVTAGTRDPQTGRIDWAKQNQYVAPNKGRYLVGHVDTFINRYSSLASVYRDYDEALTDSRDNARFMRNDVGIRECLDSRQRSVALLNWHVEPEDERSASQIEFCSMLENVVKRISHFYEYRRNCQHAIWYGKYGIQHRWGVQVVDNKSVYMPTPRHQDDWGWQPLNGDKLVFRQKRPDREMPAGSYEGQLGIRVGSTHRAGDVVGGRWNVEPTDYGLAYFLSPAERRLMCVHKHHIEDAAYEDGIRAGSIYGVGIRSVIYWEYVQQKETMAFLMEFVERMAGGIQVWKYPSGNPQAEAATKEAAENYNSGQEHALLVPVPPGDMNQYGVEIIDPGFSGVEVLKDLLTDYFGHRIKRYILGQILSSESDSTGLGSGVAELHTDTLLQILKSDATNLEETLTSDLLAAIVKINVQKGVWTDPGFRPRFILETEESDVDAKLHAFQMLHQAGLDFRKTDLYEMIGMAQPGPDDDVLPGQQSGGAGGQDAAGGMPGISGGPGADPEQADAAGATPPPEARSNAGEHAAGPTEPGDMPGMKPAKPEPLHRYGHGGRNAIGPFKRSALTSGMRFTKPSKNNGSK